jgi:hypothetical protein
MNRGSIETKSRHSIEIWNRRSIGRRGSRSTGMPGRWRGQPTRGSMTAETPKRSTGAYSVTRPALFWVRLGQARELRPVSVPSERASAVPALLLPRRKAGERKLSADERASGPIAAVQPRARSFRRPPSGQDLVICPVGTGTSEALAALRRLLSDGGTIGARSICRAGRKPPAAHRNRLPNKIPRQAIVA